MYIVIGASAPPSRWVRQARIQLAFIPDLACAVVDALAFIGGMAGLLTLLLVAVALVGGP
jgi:hypothetical protein